MKNGFECDCLKFFINLIVKLLKIVIFTIGLWICVYSIPDLNIDSNIISDKLLQSTFFFGKKTHKVNYDDVQKRKINQEKEKHVEQPYWHRAEEENIHKPSTKTINKEPVEDSNSKNNIINYFTEETTECISDFDYTPYLYQLYGNRTVFHMELNDLELMVNKTYMTIGQSLIFWESLLHIKTNRANEFNNNNYIKNGDKSSSMKYQSIDLEMIILNYLPLRSLGEFLICSILFYITYFMQTRTKFSIKVYVIYNICTIQLGYLLIYYLFSLKYYFSSTCITANIGLAIRHLLELMFYDSGISKNDINIFKFSRKFSSLLKQTLIKLTVLLITLSCLFIISKEFPFCGNYIIFYSGLYYSIYVSSYYLMIEVHSMFQPLRQFIFGVVGLINLIVTSFHKHIIRFPKNSYLEENDSLYIISSIFSLICFYLFIDYVKIQAFNISSLYDNLNDEDLNEKIDSMVIKEKSKVFNVIDDVLWIFLFTLFLVTLLVALAFKNSINYQVCCFTLSSFLSPFGRLYKIKHVRILNLALLFVFVFTNQIMYNLRDATLFQVSNWFI